MRVAAPAVALVAAALTFAGTAQAYEMTWSQTQTLSATGQRATAPVVAMNEKGQAVVAYLEQDAAGMDRVRVRFREPGQNFGPPVGFFTENGSQVYASQSGTAASGPDVVIDNNGHALVSWNQNGDVFVARGTPSTGLPHFINITTSVGFASGADMAMDGQGNAIIGYVAQVNGNPRIDARYRPQGPGGNWGPTEVVWNSPDYGAPGPGASRVASSPIVTMDPLGNAAFAWTANMNFWNQDTFLRDVWAAWRPAGGPFETGYRFPTATRGSNPGYAARSAGPTDIEIRNGGETIVGWQSSDSSDSRVHVQRRPGGGPWNPNTETLSHVEPSNNFSGHNFGPSLALAPQGNVIANWTRNPDTDVFELHENWLGASASAFEPRRRITPQGAKFGGSIVGFDASGNGLLATLAYGPPNTDSDQWTAGIRFAGNVPTYAPESVVSEKGNFLGSSWDVLGSGAAVVAWSRIPNEGADLTRRIEVRFGTPFTPGGSNPGTPDPDPDPDPVAPGVPPAPPPPVDPPPPPPPPIPQPNGSILPARAPKAGEALVLTANTVGPVERLEWDLGPGQPKVTAGVVNGRLQNSIRLRPEAREYQVSVTAIGPGGRRVLGRTITLPRDPTDALAKEVDRGLSKSGIGKVVAIGDASVLTGQSSGCGPVSVISGLQTLTGCFKPIDDITDLPSRELGALAPLAKELGLNEARADLMNRAVELSDGFITQAQLAIPGGWPVVPAGGASLVSFPQAEVLVSSNAGIPIGGVSFKPDGKGFMLKLDRSATTTALGKLPRPPSLPKIGGFDLGSDFDITLLPNNEARIKAKIKLPSFIKKAGADVEASVTLRATTQRFLVEDLTIGPINVNVGALKVDNFRITYTGANDEWVGTGQACVVEVACLDMRPPNGHVRIKNGRLEYAGASLGFPLPGIPLATGVNMERVGFGIGLNPTRFTGNAKIAFAHALIIDGRLVMAFPSADTPFTLRRDEVGDSFPARLYDYRYTGFTIGITADASLRLPVVGDVPLGGAYVLYEYPGYLALGGRMDYGFKTGDITWIGVQGSVDGEFYSVTGKFNLDGNVRACVIDIFCKGVRGNVSSHGMAVCASVSVLVGSVNAGGAIRWSPFKFIPYLAGCRWNRFREANVRPVKAAQAGAPVYTMDRGDAGDAAEMVMLNGQDGAPRVRVTGPGGEVLDSPTGSEIVATRDRKLSMMRSDQGKFVAVALDEGASRGDYEIEMLPGSPGITKVEETTALPEAKGAGIVKGAGARKTLTYDITNRPNQRITFVDIDQSGAATEIKTVNGGGRGTFAFRPKPGKQIRRIEARIELDGVPAETLPIARYRPPSPVLPKPAGLKVRRRGTKLVVTWRRVADARNYELVLTPSGSEDQKFFTTKRTSITLKSVAKTTAGTVSVMAAAPERQGRPSRARFKRTARSASPFGDLMDCKRKGKKLTCR